MKEVTGIRAKFQALAAIFWKSIKDYTRRPGSFGIYLALPFFFTLLIFGMGQFVGGGNASTYFAARTGTTNILVYEMLGGAVWMTSWLVVEDVGVSLRNEQVSGTLEQNFLAPIDRATLLVGMSLADIVITTPIFLIAVGVTVLLTMPADIVGLFQAYLMLLIGLVPLFGICFLFSGIIIRFKEPYVFVQIVNVLFAVLTGTYYPVALLPFWIRFLSGLLPQTYVIEDMRQIILANQNLVSLYGNIFVLFALALIYPTIGYAIFKRIERKASVTGEFSKY